MTEQEQALRSYLRPLVRQGICLAFSAGVDSSLLLYLTCQEAAQVGKTVQAVIFATQLHPAADVVLAQQLCDQIGATLHVVKVDEFSIPAVKHNAPDRCYHCKKKLFTQLKETAHRLNCGVCMDGTNADDLKEYRPGLRALKELGIASPLAELGITKVQVRQMAGELGIAVAQRPSSPCLATRLPYGAEVTPQLLRRIEQGENLMKEMGFPVVRVRVHGDIVRLEVPLEHLSALLEQRPKVVDGLHELGFSYITVDLEGFRSGSMDIGRSREESYGRTSVAASGAGGQCGS